LAKITQRRRAESIRRRKKTFFLDFGFPRSLKGARKRAYIEKNVTDPVK
jgi:hypothetical protein